MGGNDRLSSSSGNDILEGGEGDDILNGGSGITEASYVSANAGVRVNLAVHHYQDTLGAGVDTLSNIDNLTGSAFADILKGDVGSNVLTGNGGDDRLFGSDGNDTLTGGSGYDRMYGGMGDDIFYVNDTMDFAYELAGEGVDTVIASASVRLRDNVENLTLVDTAYIGKGNALDNVIIAHDLGAKLYGFDGNDDLEGGAGQDFLNGGTGSDIVRGGGARDIVTGGDGNDVFVFADGEFGGLSTWTADRISDFASGDKIDLSGVDANTVLAGDQAFGFIGASAFTGTAGELRYENISGSTYITGDTDGDGHADFIIKLDGLHALSANDLVL
jgi:Ca2+-binding RTX toxin-like protein